MNPERERSIDRGVAHEMKWTHGNGPPSAAISAEPL